MRSPRHCHETWSRRLRLSGRNEPGPMSGHDTDDIAVLRGSVRRVTSANTMNADAIAAEVDSLWEVFRSDRTVDLSWRKAQLHGVRAFLNENRHRILSALAADLGKPAFEAYAADIGAVLSEARLLGAHLPKLTRPRKVPTPLLNQPASSWIYPEPVGPVLLLPAW